MENPGHFSVEINIDATVSGIGAPREIRWREGKEPGKDRKAEDAGNQPERARPLSHSGPHREATGDFGKSGAGVDGERCGCSHSVASASGCR